MITSTHLLLTTSLLMILGSFLLSMFVIFQNRTVEIFRYIGLAQFFLFLMVLIFSLLYWLDVTTIESIQHDYIGLVIKLGNVFGLIGAIFWFFMIDLLRTKTLDNSLLNILRLRGKYLLTGFAIGVNILSLDYRIVDNHVQTFYSNALSFYLTPLVFLLFFITQYRLFNKKIEEFQKKNLFLSIIIYVYLISIFLALFFLILGTSFIINIAVWIFFGSLSQLAFSYLILAEPLVLLTNEKPDMLLFLSGDFKNLLYVKKFSDSITFSEHLILSYLSGLTALGSKVVYGSGVINKIMFRDIVLLLKTFENYIICYLYNGISFYSTIRFNNFSQSLLNNKDIWPWLLDKSDSEGYNKFENLIQQYFSDKHLKMKF